MKILIINGANLNMTGKREPEIYGSETLDEINGDIKSFADTKGVEVDFFQSNYEGAIIDTIHSAMGKYDGIVINPGAYTHYSYAIRDAISSVTVPAVEVHISDIHAREEFRHTSVIAPVCIKQIYGMGKKGYMVAIEYLMEKAN
ncbi:MAG: type II 3-dehydroquinate dehydratase [Eubacteriales bacterium]|nr:type II 3-dehydroquinate dehydratase [Eubacteriales bacterium]